MTLSQWTTIFTPNLLEEHRGFTFMTPRTLSLLGWDSRLFLTAQSIKEPSRSPELTRFCRKAEISLLLVAPEISSCTGELLPLPVMHLKGKFISGFVLILSSMSVGD